MKAIIVGCGRVGGLLAGSLDAGGHDVTIIDTTTRSFDRLPATFRGEAVRGDGTDEDVLRRAGAESAQLFLAMTEGDNRNIMAAQLARETLGIPMVYAKINDPVRAEAYAEIGIGTICRTTMMADALLDNIDLPSGGQPAIRRGVPHDHATAPAATAPAATAPAATAPAAATPAPRRTEA